MSNAHEKAANSEQVSVFFGDEIVILDRWTLTTLKAYAYDEGKTLDEVFSDMIKETMADPERLSRVVDRCRQSEALVS